MTNEEARKLATQMAIDLFTDVSGRSARRLMMDYDGNGGGTGWSIEAVEERLTKALQEASTAREGQTITVDGVEYGENSVRLLQQQASECRAAGFIDDAGNVRTLLGDLPVDKLGRVIGTTKRFHTIHRDEVIECGMFLMKLSDVQGNALAFEPDAFGDTDDADECHDLFHTRESALSSTEKGEAK